ncbi:MAG: hypothetical protein RSB99_01945 [Bacilli bacterium]
MFTHLFFFLIGFGLTVIGCTYWVIYLNLMTVGFTLIEYITFSLSRVECLYAIIGFIIMTLAIFLKGGHILDLYI